MLMFLSNVAKVSNNEVNYVEVIHLSNKHQLHKSEDSTKQLFFAKITVKVCMLKHTNVKYTVYMEQKLN